MTAPHPQRCETCDYFIGKMKNFFDVDQPFCRNPKIIEANKLLPETGGQISKTEWRIEDHTIMKGDMYFQPMSKGEVFAISVLGCASHSTALNVNDVQAIRNAILDDLDKLALKEAKERSIKEGGLSFVSVQVWIEQLRTRTQEQLAQQDGEQR